MNTPLVNTILVFLTVTAVLYAIKPETLFNRRGKMKKFGIGKGKTCFSFPVVVFMVTLVSYVMLRMLSRLKFE
jgi:hypothetical protein